MKQAVFVSPHLDDAVFSAGAMMLLLKSMGYAITVLNVCSEGGDLPQTLSASAYMKQVGYESSKALYEERRNEDRQALEKMGVKSVMLGNVEALWRKPMQVSKLTSFLARFLPEFAHVYPTYKFHIASGKIRSGDRRFVQAVTEQIADHVSKDTLLFAPLGIGGHVDHIVARTAAQGVGVPVIYWADIPYIVRPHATPSRLDISALEKSEISKTSLLSEKEKYCALYKTQYKPVFDTLHPKDITETFYYPKELVTRIGGKAESV